MHLFLDSFPYRLLQKINSDVRTLDVRQQRAEPCERPGTGPCEPSLSSLSTGSVRPREGPGEPTKRGQLWVHGNHGARSSRDGGSALGEQWPARVWANYWKEGLRDPAGLGQTEAHPVPASQSATSQGHGTSTRRLGRAAAKQLDAEHAPDPTRISLQASLFFFLILLTEG